MGIEKKFIEDAITRYRVGKYLEGELERTGFSEVDIQRTPMVTRIAVRVVNPGKVIGRKGKNIQDLTDNIKREFKIDNPQVSVVEIEHPALDPSLIARRACGLIERGRKTRAILHHLLEEIMGAGALGAELVASGKIVAKGGRARSLRVVAGYVPKVGEPARQIANSCVTAYPKSGAISIHVRIVLPGTVFPGKNDKAKKREAKAAAREAAAAAAAAETAAAKIVAEAAAQNPVQEAEAKPEEKKEKKKHVKAEAKPKQVAEKGE